MKRHRRCSIGGAAAIYAAFALTFATPVTAQETNQAGTISAEFP